MIAHEAILWIWLAMPGPGPIEAMAQQRQAERLEAVMFEAAVARVAMKDATGNPLRVDYGSSTPRERERLQQRMWKQRHRRGLPLTPTSKAPPALVAKVRRIPYDICAVWGKSDAFVEGRIRRYRRLKNSRDLSRREVQEKAVKSCSFKADKADVPLCEACMEAVVREVFER